MADQQIVIDIVTRLDKLERDMNKAGAHTEKFGKRIKKLATTLAAVSAGIFVVVKGIGSLVKAYAKQEKEEALLLTALKNRVATEEEALAVQQKMIKFAKQRQGVTTFSDEESIAALKIAGTFPLATHEMEQLLIRAQDFSAATGKDLVSAMADLGRATEGQFGMLSRYGVSIRDVTKETGDFNMLMEDLDSNFGGMAETMAKTVEGRWKQLGNLIGDAKERLGEALLPAIERLMPFIEKLPDLMDKLSPTLVSVVDALSTLGEALFPLVEDLLPAIAPLFTGIAEAIKFVGSLLKPFTQEIGKAIKDLSTLIGFMQTGDVTQLRGLKLNEIDRILKQKGQMGDINVRGLASQLGLGEFTSAEEARAAVTQFRGELYRSQHSQRLTPGEIAGAGGLSDLGEPTIPTGGGAGKEPKETPEEKRERLYQEEVARLRALDTELEFSQVIAEQNRVIEENAEAARKRFEETAAAAERMASRIQGSMNLVADLIKTGFEEGLAGAWKAIKELALKVATAAVIQTAVKLITTLLAPESALGQMSWGKAIGGSILGALGLQPGGQDNPHNDNLIKRSFDHLGKFMVEGLRNGLLPQAQFSGAPIYISTDTDFVKYSVSRSDDQRVAMGRQFRRMIAADQETDI